MGGKTYEQKLFAMGLTGPIGEVKVNGAYYLEYRCAQYHVNVRVPPPNTLSPAEEAETLERVATHLNNVRAKLDKSKG